MLRSSLREFNGAQRIARSFWFSFVSYKISAFNLWSQRLVTFVGTLAGDGRLSKPGQPRVRPECRTAPYSLQSGIARIRLCLPSKVLRNAGGFYIPQFDHRANPESAFETAGPVFATAVRPHR